MGGWEGHSRSENSEAIPYEIVLLGYVMKRERQKDGASACNVEQRCERGKPRGTEQVVVTQR